MNLAWAKRWAEAFNARDNAQILELYADDVMFEDLFFRLELVGREQFLRALEAYAAAPGRSSNEVVDYVGDEHGGAIRWIWHFDPAGSFMGHEVGGRSCNVTGFSVIKLREGKIVRESDIVDGISVMEELGVLCRKPVQEIDRMHGRPGWILAFADQP